MEENNNRIAIGWTRTSNINGFNNKTYDVINFWRRGPDKEVWSNVPVYATGDKPYGYSSNYNQYMSGIDNVLTCWHNKESDRTPLYL